MNKTIIANGKKVNLGNVKFSEQGVSFVLDGKKFNYKLDDFFGSEVYFRDGDRRIVKELTEDNDDFWIGENSVKLGDEKLSRGSSHLSEGSLVSPMPGKIFKVIKNEGEIVSVGDTILILEAMKMEHAIKANKEGKVSKILFKEGDLVEGGKQLVQLD